MIRTTRRSARPHTTDDPTLARDGFAIVPDALDPSAVDALLACMVTVRLHLEYVAAEWTELPGGLAWHEGH